MRSANIVLIVPSVHRCAPVCRSYNKDAGTQPRWYTVTTVTALMLCPKWRSLLHASLCFTAQLKYVCWQTGAATRHKEPTVYPVSRLLSFGPTRGSSYKSTGNVPGKAGCPGRLDRIPYDKKHQKGRGGSKSTQPGTRTSHFDPS